MTCASDPASSVDVGIDRVVCMPRPACAATGGEIASGPSARKSDTGTHQGGPTRPDRRMAFSLVELLAVMVSGAVLAITAGTLLFFGFLGWRRHSQALDMQRDATLAMKVVGDAVRESHARAVPPPVGSRLVIPRNGFTSEVYQTSNNLMFDPSVNRSGDDYTLVAGRVTGFVPSVTNGVVRMTLDVREPSGDASVRYEGRFKCRN